MPEDAKLVQLKRVRLDMTAYVRNSNSALDVGFAVGPYCAASVGPGRSHAKQPHLRTSFFPYLESMCFGERGGVFC